jgi:hypothetical protein
MARERRCHEVGITIWFDSPVPGLRARSLDVGVEVCEGMDIDSIVGQVLDELAERWAEKVKPEDISVVEDYKEALYPHVERYVLGALANVLQDLRRAAETCREGEEIETEEEDGYYDEDTKRGIYVRVTMSASCEELRERVAVVEDIVGTTRVTGDIVRDTCAVVEEKYKSIFEPILDRLSPHEEILLFLEQRFRIGWWYTVYYTSNVGG